VFSGAINSRNYGENESCRDAPRTCRSTALRTAVCGTALGAGLQEGSPGRHRTVRTLPKPDIFTRLARARTFFYDRKRFLRTSERLRTTLLWSVDARASFARTTTLRVADCVAVDIASIIRGKTAYRTAVSTRVIALKKIVQARFIERNSALIRKRGALTTG